MVRVVAYLAGGIVAVLAMDFVAATTILPSIEAAETSAAAIDRSRKGDRLSAPRPADHAGPVVAGASRLIFPANSSKNVTEIGKGAGSPKLIIRSTREPVPGTNPVVRGPGRGVDTPPVLPAAVPERKLPDGCEPSFSPVASPALSHITGRCIADAAPTRKFASLHQ